MKKKSKGIVSPTYSDRYQGGPPPLLQGDLLRPQGDRGAGESGSIVPGLDSQASEVLGTGGPLYT